jgi:hypothetical protein
MGQLLPAHGSHIHKSKYKLSFILPFGGQELPQVVTAASSGYTSQGNLSATAPSHHVSEPTHRVHSVGTSVCTDHSRLAQCSCTRASIQDAQNTAPRK